MPPAPPRRQRRFARRQGRADRGTNNSCLENQVKDATNKAITVGQLQSYCDCYAKAFAEVMTVEDLDKNKDSLTPEIFEEGERIFATMRGSSLKK